MPYADYRTDQGLTPAISKRAPTTKDKGFELGTMWIDTALNDVYVLTSVKANLANWEGTGGGTGSFSALSVNPGNATITAGDLTVTAGSITASALSGGVVQTSVAGVMGSSKGNNGEILIGSTAGLPQWAALASGDGSIAIVNTANHIDISATGGTSSTYITDTAGPVSPLAGALSVLGGSNLTTDGSVANTITIDLDDSISLVGAVTAGVDLNMTSGKATITSTTNAAKSIYLHANAGTTETIEIYSDQGNAIDSVYVHSDDGGVKITGGLGTANAVNISTTDAAGGVSVASGTAGISLAATNGAVSVTSGTGTISIGADAAAHTVTVGSTTGASALALQCGTGAFSVTAGDIFDIDAVAALSLNSSTSVINIGNDAVAQNINIGTGSAARTITIGNNSGASALTLVAGTGAIINMLKKELELQ